MVAPLAAIIFTVTLYRRVTMSDESRLAQSCPNLAAVISLVFWGTVGWPDAPLGGALSICSSNFSNGSSNRRGQSPGLSRDPVLRGRTLVSARDRFTKMPEFNLTWPYRA